MTASPSSTPSPAKPLAAGRVFVVMVIALLGGALLNAQAILRTAENKELGRGRSVALFFAEPLASVSSVLRIDTPREAVDEALGREFTGRNENITLPPVTTPTTSTTVPGGQATTTTSTTLPPRRVVTADDPLDLWIIGDSFAELFGPALVNRSTGTGLIDAEVDFQFISGLTRPDYFDWPAYIAEQLPKVTPDATVVIFGGNDAQDVIIGGQKAEVGSEDWIALYAVRVGEAMDTLLTGVETVYWVGMPIMESASFTANVQIMNAVYEAEAAARTGVTYVPSFDLFKDENGGYNAYLDGKQMRYSDGAHFTWNGGYRLADEVLSVIATEWRLP